MHSFISRMKKHPPHLTFFSQLMHFSPFVLIPHTLQYKAKLTASCEGVFAIFTIRIIAIKIPTAIPIQISTIYYIIPHRRF